MVVAAAGAGSREKYRADDGSNEMKSATSNSRPKLVSIDRDRGVDLYVHLCCFCRPGSEGARRLRCQTRLRRVPLRPRPLTLRDQQRMRS